MWWQKAQSRNDTLLDISLDARLINTVSRTELPYEKQLPIHLASTEPLLKFRDSSGQEHQYDLSSACHENKSWLHLNIRVHESFVVQSDCMLSTDEKIDDEAVRNGNWIGIRFQPFYLPQCKADPQSLIGRGLFYRGLHFPGTITQGNVSLLCICDHCHKSFRIQSFHAGFSNQVYFYCDHGPHTLRASAYLNNAPSVLGPSDPTQLASFESKLPNCEKCGGLFRYYNPFRCPHCLAPYIDFARHPKDRESEYYGNYLYGDSIQKWIP
ncbi:MAG TPA: hypothetical protein VFE58_03270 [Tepidisphaeraceae bacterium]|jgi:hypothetical protein|nr:hypothetical protein [Tepidisphaeraceae bacterium]